MFGITFDSVKPDVLDAPAPGCRRSADQPRAPAGSEFEDCVAFPCGENALEQADVLDRLGVKPVIDRHRGAENSSIQTRDSLHVGDAGPDTEEVDDEPRLWIARHRREV